MLGLIQLLLLLLGYILVFFSFSLTSFFETKLKKKLRFFTYDINGLFNNNVVTFNNKDEL